MTALWSSQSTRLKMRAMGAGSSPGLIRHAKSESAMAARASPEGRA
jgi:hypothetical protein